jgi:hypothetical protein
MHVLLYTTTYFIVFLNTNTSYQYYDVAFFLNASRAGFPISLSVSVQSIQREHNIIFQNDY